MKPYRLIQLCLMLLLLTACSIKEQRGSCPVYLNINFDRQIQEEQSYDSYVNVRARNPVFSENVDIRQYESIGLDVPAPRGTIRVSAAFGYEGFECSGDSLKAIKGKEISPLFLWAETVFSQDDLCFVEAMPRKQFCRMNIMVVGLNPGEDFEYDMRLRANCNALSLYGAKALEGDYTVFAERRNASGYEVLVPRQKENKILLEIVEDDRNIVVLDLGSHMEESAYNWNKADLDDVIVLVDYTGLSLSIKVLEWKNNKLEVII